MKSKHIVNYGKNTTSSFTQSVCRSYHYPDNLRYKSTITAFSTKTVIIK